MLQEAKDLQNSAVTKLVNILTNEKKEYTFKAPTGSGKTYMMADFMNRIIAANEDIVFIVSTLSKSNLAEQNYKSFKDLTENGTFPNLNPYLINSDSSGEASIFIPTDYNIYVLPRDLYKDTAKLKKEGTFLNFLQTMTSTLFDTSKGKRIYLIKDECHIATNNLDELQNLFTKIINFSATPKLSRRQNPDVEITNEEAEGAKIIKKVEEGDKNATLADALNKLEEIKTEYINLLNVNPCLIIQISNKDKAEEELNNIIKPALANHQDLKWIYISSDEKECDSNDTIKKLPVSKWKDYMKLPQSSISIIIFKMVISEGYDIPRACMLYQIRDSQSKQLDEQVMGRVRRNPRLLDFETLSEKAKELAMTAWIWGILPDTKGSTKQVNLAKNYGVEEAIRITPTKLQNITATKGFDINSYINSLNNKQITHQSIFDMYQKISKLDNEIQALCYSYADSYTKWRIFAENLSSIKTSYDAYICDYEKSMVVCDNVSFPCESCYVGNDKTITLEDWIWCRKDSANDFSFDSDAEKQWAKILNDIQYISIEEIENKDNADFDNKFLWGKNYPFNSEIKFEYYLNGIHSSYPDFIMKDKNGRIHIFEVKSVNKSSSLTIDEEEYKAKVLALEACYKQCSIKTGHLFYLPILQDSIWKIIRYENGVKKEISKREFIESVRQTIPYTQQKHYGEIKAAVNTDEYGGKKKG